MRRHVRFLLVVGLAAASCLACSSGATSVSAAATAPTLLVHNVRGGGADAEVNGYLRYLDEADCFVLEPGPGIRNVAVWPPSSQVLEQDGQVAGVEVPSIGVIRLGEWVSGGGGYANPATSDLDLPAVGSQCLSGGGEFALLHRITGAEPGPIT